MHRMWRRRVGWCEEGRTLADGLAQKLGSRLVLVHAAPVAPSVMYGVPFDNDAFQRQILDDSKNLLGDVAGSCHAADVARHAELGKPTDVLERVIEQEQAELLVLGTRGRGAMRSVLLGSVAHEMLAVSSCPVVIVPPHAVP